MKATPSPAMIDQPQNQQQTSPLLRLPGELRNKIYHYVLEDHVTGIGRKQWRNLKQWRKPALLRTCKELRSEALSLYYSAYVIIERFDITTKQWKTLTAPEALQLTLQPWKHDDYSAFLEKFEIADAREYAEKWVRSDDRLRARKGFCILRYTPSMPLREGKQSDELRRQVRNSLKRYGIDLAADEDEDEDGHQGKDGKKDVVFDYFYQYVCE